MRKVIVTAMGAILLLSFVIVFLLLQTRITTQEKQNSSSVTSQENHPQSKNTVLFPSSTDTLVKGQQYTLKWTPGSKNIQVFLIDTALESQGESVSIVDRIYDVKNTGKYDYNVPKNISDGVYKFMIGTATSDKFQIVSTEQSTSYCTPDQIQANLTLSPAAGNVYGTLTLQNVSDDPCQIAGDNSISVDYDKNRVTNIEVAHKGEAQQQLFTTQPNQTLYSQIHYPNGPQCSANTTSLPVKFSYKISPMSSVTFINQNEGELVNINRCKSNDEVTVIDIWNISTQPISP